MGAGARDGAFSRSYRGPYFDLVRAMHDEPMRPFACVVHFKIMLYLFVAFVRSHIYDTYSGITPTLLLKEAK